MAKYTYFIKQLPVSNNRCFRLVTYKTITLGDYVNVYSFESDYKWELEEIYDKFNDPDKIPVDYYTRSLSIGDVIVVIKNKNNKIKTKYYVVDFQGFRKVKLKNV